MHNITEEQILGKYRDLEDFIERKEKHVIIIDSNQNSNPGMMSFLTVDSFNRPGKTTKVENIYLNLDELIGSITIKAVFMLDAQEKGRLGLLLKGLELCAAIAKASTIKIDKEKASIIYTLHKEKTKIHEKKLYEAYVENCKTYDVTPMLEKDFSMHCSELERLKCISIENNYISLKEKVLLKQ